MEPGLSLIECPSFELMRELGKFGPCDEIFELCVWRRHAAGDFVATDAREDYSVSLRRQTGCELTDSF